MKQMHGYFPLAWLGFLCSRMHLEFIYCSFFQIQGNHNQHTSLHHQTGQANAAAILCAVRVNTAWTKSILSKQALLGQRGHRQYLESLMKHQVQQAKIIPLWYVCVSGEQLTPCVKASLHCPCQHPWLWGPCLHARCSPDLPAGNVGFLQAVGFVRNEMTTLTHLSCTLDNLSILPSAWPWQQSPGMTSTKSEVWQRSSGQRNLLGTGDAGINFHYCIPFNPLPRPGSTHHTTVGCIPVLFQSLFPTGAQSSPSGCSQTQWLGQDLWLMEQRAAWPRFPCILARISRFPHCRLSRSCNVSLRPNPGTLLRATQWKDFTLLLLSQLWAQQELLLWALNQALTSSPDWRCQRKLCGSFCWIVLTGKASIDELVTVVIFLGLFCLSFQFLFDWVLMILNSFQPYFVIFIKLFFKKCPNSKEQLPPSAHCGQSALVV